MTKSASTKFLQGISALTLVAGLACGGAARAQTAQAATGAGDLADGDVVVTARRKEESLLETPVAITALSGDELAARNIVNLQDLSQSVPGANVVNQASSGGRSDRSFQAVVLRGIAPSTGNLQTVSVFIDGVPVSSSIALQTITSPERIEILKGPQSAYFGRQTFAGAINVVNKLPSEELSGSISGLAGTRANYDATLELSGPLLGDDKLGFRLTARAIGKDGSYHNAANSNETLGNQKTKTGSLLLVAKPSDNLTFKLFGSIVQENDGAPAQGLISAYDVRDASGALAAVSQSNCTVNGNPFFCGTAPKLSAYTPAQTTSLSAAFLANLRTSTVGRLVDPSDGPQSLGLTSRTYHAHLGIDWKLGDTGVTLSSLTGYNKTWYSEVADADNLASTNFAAYSAGGGFNTLVLLDSQQRDYSQELRATFENGGPFHATVGANYLDTKSQGSFGSSGSTVNGTLALSVFGASGARTLGGFFGLGYDITSKFSVNVDGRYQVDRVASYAGPAGSTVTNDNLGVPKGVYAANAKIVEVAYKNFTPRVIAQYKPNGDTMMYASYSKGVNPGVFNTTLLTQKQQALDIAKANNIGVIVAPEKLTNYEIGFKGKAFDRRVTYEIAVFHALWTNQINQQSFVYTDANAATQSFVVSTNTGRTNIKGAEVNLGVRVAHGLTLDLGGAYIDSVIASAANGPITVLTGRTDFSGNHTPLVSKWAGTAAAQYIMPLVPEKDLDLFSRVDFTYKSGGYADISNLVKGPDMTNVNLTLGVQTKRFSVQGFVTNLFNNDAYYSVITQTLNAPVTHAAPAALVAQLRDLRTVGIKGSIKF